MSDDDKQDEIDNRCSDSWDIIKDFYHRLIYENEFDTWGFLKPVISLIKEMQDYGYDRWLCLGQSHYWLTVSFPNESKPKKKHQIIVVEFYSEGDIAMIVDYRDGEANIVHEFGQITFTDELKTLLDRMVSKLKD